MSAANDDCVDNYFLPPLGPLSSIEEDGPARYIVRDHWRL
jgi:D-lyxose ketol-isomerase